MKLLKQIKIIKANKNLQWLKVKDALSEIYNKDFSFAWTWYESFKKRVKKEFPNTPTSKSDGSYKKVFTYCSNNKLDVFEVLKEIYWKEEIEEKFIFLKEVIEGKKLKEILKKETDLQEIKKGFLKVLKERPSISSYHYDFLYVNIITKWKEKYGFEKLSDFLDFIYWKKEKTTSFEVYRKIWKFKDRESFKKELFEIYKWDFENLKRDRKVLNNVSMQLYTHWENLFDFFKETFWETYKVRFKWKSIRKDVVADKKVIDDEVKKFFREKFPVDVDSFSWHMFRKNFKGYDRLYLWCKRANIDFYKTIYEIYWVKFYTDKFSPYLKETIYKLFNWVKPSKNKKWKYGISAMTKIWRKIYVIKKKTSLTEEEIIDEIFKEN